MAAKCIQLALGAAVVAASVMVMSQNAPAQSQEGMKTPVPKVVPDPPLPAPKQTIPEKIVPCEDDGDLDVTEFDRCNGVIKPTPGVDSEIVNEPPDRSGTTPVVPPRDVEPQDPSD